MKPFANPIWRRELKERMRSRRTFVGFTVYLAILGLVLYFTERGAARDATSMVMHQATAGRLVFQVIVLGMLLLLCFLIPGYAAGSISAERERQTFHLVQVTLMRPYQIVLGKLGATVSWLLFLVVASLPFVAVGFLLGGVSLTDVLRAYGIIVFTGLALGIVAIAVSARARRTTSAVLVSQAIVLSLLIGTPVLYGLARAQDPFSVRQSDPTWLLVPNPVVGAAAAIGDPQRGGTGPFDAIAGSVTQETMYYTTMQLQRTPRSTMPVLLGYLGLYTAIAALAWRLSLTAVAAPSQRMRVPALARRRAVQEGP